MDFYILLSLVAMLFWGFWTFFPKLAGQYIDAKSILIYQSLAILLVSISALIYFKFDIGTHPKGIMYAFLSGLFAIIGSGAFIYALTKSGSSIVIVISGMYPIVGIILSYLILSEPLGLYKILGILSAIIAIVLFSL